MTQAYGPPSAPEPPSEEVRSPSSLEETARELARALIEEANQARASMLQQARLEADGIIAAALTRSADHPPAATPPPAAAPAGSPDHLPGPWPQDEAWREVGRILTEATERAVAGFEEAVRKAAAVLQESLAASPPASVATGPAPSRDGRIEPPPPAASPPPEPEPEPAPAPPPPPPPPPPAERPPTSGEVSPDAVTGPASQEGGPATNGPLVGSRGRTVRTVEADRGKMTPPLSSLPSEPALAPPSPEPRHHRRSGMRRRRRR